MMQAKLVENIGLNNGKPFIFQHFTEFRFFFRAGVSGPEGPDLLTILAGPEEPETRFVYDSPLV